MGEKSCFAQPCAYTPRTVIVTVVIFKEVCLSTVGEKNRKTRVDLELGVYENH